MTDSCSFQVSRLRQPLLPFHSSARPATRRTDRQMTRRITVRRGRSSYTTLSARSQTSGSTAV
jgi:hypothetical protein